MINGRDPPRDVSGYEVKHRIGFVHKLENWVVSRIVDPAGVSNTNLQSLATRHLVHKLFLIKPTLGELHISNLWYKHNLCDPVSGAGGFKTTACTSGQTRTY